MTQAEAPGAGLDLRGARRVHFVGIAGAGMSAIAKVLLERGHVVSGTDLKRSPLVTVLEATGAVVRVGHSERFFDECRPDVVVASSAIPPSNPELRRAAEHGVRVMSRGEALAGVLHSSPSIVVAGTHGKTTTTSMIVSILRADGRDPTYLVGGGLNDAGTNARSGSDDLAVAESDESDGSFLLLSPRIGVVTNVEIDHLDYWGSEAELREAFARFVGGIEAAGTAVVPASDEPLLTLAAGAGRNVVSFGDGGAVRAESWKQLPIGASFDLVHADDRVKVELQVPGFHNVANALAAAAACLSAGVGLPAIARGLGSFRGVERRFEVRGRAEGITLIDDYAHHPTEVRATLSAARPGPWERVVAIFQPHRYSRTQKLYRDFGPAFADADRVIVTDVYGAGEPPVPGVTGKLVADAVCESLPGRPVAYLPHRSELLSYVESTAREGDVILTLGAGDISSVGDEILCRVGAPG